MCGYQPKIVFQQILRDMFTTIMLLILSIIASALHDVDICWSLSIKVFKVF